jgi:hypothetical protein
VSAEFTCRDERRRQLIRDQKLNGVDYVDVEQKHLCVHFLTSIPQDLTTANVVIRGGRRITNIVAMNLDPHASDDAFGESCLGIELDRAGDWSTYTLCFVEAEDGQPTERPLRSLDPRYACLDFSFKVDCPAEIDCKSEVPCPLPAQPRPAINYLAKDYATFRQLILDRMALLVPEWRERHVPDVGIALVELLAYAGDYLSYYQDAVVTEQYLDTARRRISVRRHARLVDYAMHEGCNARAFVALHVAGNPTIRTGDVYFTTRPTGVVLPAALHDAAIDPSAVIVFEPLSARPEIALRQAHNAIPIYTWGDRECCIPKGATRATLLDDFDEVVIEANDPKAPLVKLERPRKLRLTAGDFLLFEELACAGTVFRSTKAGDGGFDGETPQPDVDRTHRHVVRLTKVEPGFDALTNKAIVEVEWSGEDALPFALCVSAIGTAPECDYVDGLAVARGNIVLVDHGRTIRDEPLEPIGEAPADDVCEGEDELSDVVRVPRRYRPTLRSAPLTFAEPPAAGASAASLLQQAPRAALPQIAVSSIPTGRHGTEPLFSPADLVDARPLAAKLVAPEEPALKSLRKRLRHDVQTGLDAVKDPSQIDAGLREALVTNLRALTTAWTPRADLLASGDDADFVAEVDDDGVAHLRFGDGVYGRAVEVGTTFVATYRAGNGREGLVGGETIAHIVFRNGFDPAVDGVRNPLPSAGAIDPEPVPEVKMFAPTAFRKALERAVTGDDYGTLAQVLRHPARNPRVQSAAGRLRWNGSWYAADVAIDPLGITELDVALRDSISASLFRVRRMGHDLRVGAARYVPLLVELDLCVKPDYLRAHVVAAVREALGNRALPDGRRGFFHPDNLTFGGLVAASQIVAAVMAVDGVAEVHVVRLERLAHGRVVNPDRDKGILKLAPGEVARLDNDPASPENGLLRIRRVRGGR